MSKTLAVVIGRMQIKHKQHQELIDFAISKSDHTLVLVGSANRCRSPKNPFTFEERKHLIRSVYPDKSTLTVKPLNDFLYEEYMWESDVQRISHKVAQSTGCTKFVIVGCRKEIDGKPDPSTYYLESFPTWKGIYFPQQSDISATELRESWYTQHDNFDEDNENFEASWLVNTPKPVAAHLGRFKGTAEFLWLRQQFHLLQEEVEKECVFRWPIGKDCGDALVHCRAHILLVQRAEGTLGGGLWAMPGGHIHPHETFRQGVIRELKEETLIDLPDIVYDNMSEPQCFSAPGRSERPGRVNSHASFLNVTSKKLPKVTHKGDPKEVSAVRWFPIAQVMAMPTQLFDDHYFIIKRLLAEHKVQN